jgi:general secretion pathway protein C
MRRARALRGAAFGGVPGKSGASFDPGGTSVALEPTQKRLILAVVLATLTVTAFLFSQGATQLIASAFLDVAPAAPQRAARERGAAPASTRPSREEIGRAILQRNIFDSNTGAVPWDEPPPPVVELAPEETPVEEIDPNAPPPPCEGSIRLVASYVRQRSPDQSFAAITNATGASLLYMAGMNIDDRRVIAIQSDRVILQPTGGSLCSISMFGTQPAVATARTVPAVPVIAEVAPAASEGGISTEELDANIQQISETSYAVNRTLVDRLLANQAELMRTARVIPHEVDGRVVGVKIYGIRRSSLLGRLGIQNGDMLRTINGFDLTEPDSVLEAYTRLRSADRLSMSLDRRGQPVTMDYQIR